MMVENAVGGNDPVLHHPRVNVLGVGVSAINLNQAVAAIDRFIAGGGSNYVCVTGVHGVIASQNSRQLKDIHNRAGLVTPDGMPLVWISRAHGHRGVSRVYGPDLMLRVLENGIEREYKHFLYGGAEGVPELLARRLRGRFPGVRIVGTHSPPFRPLTDEEDASVVAAIDQSRADIVWVGLSTPKQEAWMAAHAGRLSAPVMIGVGAAFDFHAGLKKQAPGWMQRSGLEWLFRLLSEPRRLGPRYLVNNPLFVYLLTLQLLGLRRFPLSGSEDVPASSSNTPPS